MKTSIFTGEGRKIANGCATVFFLRYFNLVRIRCCVCVLKWNRFFIKYNHDGSPFLSFQSLAVVFGLRLSQFSNREADSGLPESPWLPSDGWLLLFGALDAFCAAAAAAATAAMLDECSAISCRYVSSKALPVDPPPAPELPWLLPGEWACCCCCCCCMAAMLVSSQCLPILVDRPKRLTNPAAAAAAGLPYGDIVAIPPDPLPLFSRWWWWWWWCCWWWWSLPPPPSPRNLCWAKLKSSGSCSSAINWSGLFRCDWRPPIVTCHCNQLNKELK